MAQGNITAKLTDIHIDWVSNRLSAHVERYQEDTDGTLNSVGGVDIQLPIVDQTLYFKAQLKIDLMAAAKAQSSKLPNVIS